MAIASTLSSIPLGYSHCFLTSTTTLSCNLGEHAKKRRVDLEKKTNDDI